ncbi:hypothetical protein HEP84_58420 [Streptomyces sp. RLB1-33]
MNAGSATCTAKLAKILRPWLGGWISTASSATARWARAYSVAGTYSSPSGRRDGWAHKCRSSRNRSSCIFCVKSISSSFSATSKMARSTPSMMFTASACPSCWARSTSSTRPRASASPSSLRTCTLWIRSAHTAVQVSTIAARAAPEA